MHALLGDEFAAFLSSYDHPPTQGLRINTLKSSVLDAVQLLPWPLEPVPWSPSGLYIPPNARAGKHPLHAAGLYYLQDPSAMAAAELLDIRPGHWVIDVAASPGGKSTHIASLLGGQGLLVSNDPVRGRIKALGENLERWGARNTVLTNAQPRELAETLAGQFDRVLVDAPCSGEGMFRKSPIAIREWSEEHVRGCAIRQTNLLNDACRLVRPGGLLLYCTCTFAPEENEEQIARFLETHDGWTLQEVAAFEGFAPGRPEWGSEISLTPGPSPDRGRGGFVLGPTADLARMMRIWPHRAAAEGHTFALLRAPGDSGENQRVGRTSPIDRKTEELWRAFRDAVLPGFGAEGHLIQRGEHLFLTPVDAPDLSGLSVVRPGLPLGVVRNGRFEPVHALALATTAGDFAQTHELREDETARYLAGDVIRASGPAGWVGMTIAGFPLGWGKRSGDAVKNHYPRGLRV
jgi:16S rRNA C967 or C1407 C5-methylase (RsmB/RsmF family)/NOL1/NOP2/fmu family ribosome biogenesis protein